MHVIDATITLGCYNDNTRLAQESFELPRQKPEPSSPWPLVLLLDLLQSLLLTECATGMEPSEAKTHTCWTLHITDVPIVESVQLSDAQHGLAHSLNKLECHRWTPRQTCLTLAWRIHQIHKVCKIICQSKGHDKILVQPVFGRKGSLSYILWSNLDLVIPWPQIYLGEHFCFR